jgi:hypothetical protein
MAAPWCCKNTVFTQGASGRLDAINGSVVQLSRASVTGGSFTTAGGGAIATAAGTTSNLSGVTNSGTLDIVNNSFLQLDGNLTNNGTVNMQSVGNFTDIIINGARTIGGTGVINLSNNAQTACMAQAARSRWAVARPFRARDRSVPVWPVSAS